MSIAELMQISDEVDLTVRRIRNILWSENRLSRLLHDVTNPDPCVQAARVIAQLHVETGHHITALLSARQLVEAGNAEVRHRLKTLVDPEKCESYVATQLPLILSGKAAAIRSL